MIILLQEDYPYGPPQEKKSIFSGKQGLINALALGSAGYLAYQNRDSIARGLSGVSSGLGRSFGPQNGGAVAGSVAAPTPQQRVATNVAPHAALTTAAAAAPAPVVPPTPQTPTQPVSSGKVATRYNTIEDATKDPIRDAAKLSFSQKDLDKIEAEFGQKPTAFDRYGQYKPGTDTPSVPESVRNMSTPPGGGKLPQREQIASKTEVSGANLNHKDGSNPAQQAATDSRNLAAIERGMNTSPGGGKVPDTTSQEPIATSIPEVRSLNITPPQIGSNSFMNGMSHPSPFGQAPGTQYTDLDPSLVGEGTPV